MPTLEAAIRSKQNRDVRIGNPNKPPDPVHL
jgi:hypothetical protein